MNNAILDQKKQIVEEITDKLKNSASAVVCEYRGLTVAEVTELRRSLRAENVELVVYKNTMTRRAAEAMGYTELEDSLKGPNAIAFSSDAVAPARVMAKFAKKHDKLVLKAGVVEGKVVNDETLKELASLPNKEGMISMLLGCLQSPVIKFACAIKAVADARGESEN
ncbi:MAG: 50S ribosomal protein L10 [Erysipelotrichaceae bacterium]|nr:50S ribosomal protein L10 [Erysipelotrichaceae bacterium]